MTIRLGLRDRVRLYIRRWKLTWRFRLAHHPLCEPYSSQVFRIRGVFLCQGCTMVSMGVIAGFIIFLGLWLGGGTVLGPLGVVVLMGVALLPAIIVDTVGMSRPWKRIARLSNGIGVGGVAWTAVVSPWYLILGYIAFIGSLIVAYRMFRKKTPSTDLCLTCDELPTKPDCSGLCVGLETERAYSEYVNELIQPTLQKMFQEQAELVQIEVP